MHRLMLALAALFALIAAAPIDTRPSVVVFPLQASSALPREASLRIVTLMSNQIALDGHVRVIPGDPDLERSGYLAAARKADAAFYVTGFLTPLGDGASLIAQLVSTQSGAVVFSSTAQINNVTDVSAQGDVLRNAILSRASPAYPTFSGDTAAATSQPAPAQPARSASTPAPEANIGGLFHHKKPAPSPSPTPSASASPAPDDSPTP